MKPARILDRLAPDPLYDAPGMPPKQARILVGVLTQIEAARCILQLMPHDDPIHKELAEISADIERQRRAALSHARAYVKYRNNRRARK